MSKKNSNSNESLENEQGQQSNVTEQKLKNPSCISHPDFEILFYCQLCDEFLCVTCISEHYAKTGHSFSGKEYKTFLAEKQELVETIKLQKQDWEEKKRIYQMIQELISKTLEEFNNTIMLKINNIEKMCQQYIDNVQSIKDKAQCKFDEHESKNQEQKSEEFIKALEEVNQGKYENLKIVSSFYLLPLEEENDIMNWVKEIRLTSTLSDFGEALKKIDKHFAELESKENNDSGAQDEKINNNKNNEKKVIKKKNKILQKQEIEASNGSSDEDQVEIKNKKVLKSIKKQNEKNILSKRGKNKVSEEDNVKKKVKKSKILLSDKEEEKEQNFVNIENKKANIKKQKREKIKESEKEKEKENEKNVEKQKENQKKQNQKEKEIEQSNETKNKKIDNQSKEQKGKKKLKYDEYLDSSEEEENQNEKALQQKIKKTLMNSKLLQKSSKRGKRHSTSEEEGLSEDIISNSDSSVPKSRRINSSRKQHSKRRLLHDDAEDDDESSFEPLDKTQKKRNKKQRK